MSVGVMKDQKLNLILGIYTSHTHWGDSFVYSESLKRELKRRLIYECRCDERLKTKTEESTRLTYTGLVVELEHLKIKTSLIDEMIGF